MNIADEMMKECNYQVHIGANENCLGRIITEFP